MSSGFLSLGLCKCCALCLENISSVPSHPDQSFCLQDPAQMPFLWEGTPRVSGPHTSSVCNGTCTLKACHIAPVTGPDHQLAPFPLPRPWAPKPRPSCPWDLPVPPPPLHPHSHSEALAQPLAWPPASNLTPSVCSPLCPKGVSLCPKLTASFPCS